MMRLSNEDMARRVAQDIPDGAYVNLGIGMPTQVANFVSDDRQVIYHSENGILGVGDWRSGQLGHPEPNPSTGSWRGDGSGSGCTPAVCADAA